jgi:hypothetical protein
MELKLYGRCCPLNPSYHHLWSEQVKVKGINMVDEQNYPTNRLGEEDMNMVSIHMMEVGVWIRWMTITTR